MEQKKSQDAWFAQPVSYIAQSFQSFFSQFSSGIRGTASEYLNLLRIKRDNYKLKTELNEIKTRLKIFEETQLENDRLRNILDFQKNTKMELIPAQVIGRDLLPDHKSVTINKGTQHGLKHLQAVLTVSGAVGYIFKPAENTSHVILITDRYSVVDALIQKSRAHGLAEGTGKEEALLQYVDRTEAVKAGDLIVTGGLDNIFPKGFPLGVVAKVETRSQKAALTIHIKPIVESEKIEEVFIVTNAAQEDFFPREVQGKDTQASAQEKNK